MAADESSVGRLWVSGPPQGVGEAGGEADGGPPPIGKPVNVTGKPAANITGTAAIEDFCFYDERGKQKGLLHFETEDSNSQTPMLESSEVGQGSGTVLTLSPPRSPSTWGSTASDHFSYGESSMLNENEGSDGFLSEFVHLDGPLSFQEAELDSGFEDLAADLSVSELKGKLDSEDVRERTLLQGSATGYRDFLHRGPNLEVHFGSGTQLPLSPSSMEGLPLRGADINLDAELLHAETQEMLQAMDAKVGSVIEGEQTNVEESQQGTVCLHSKTDMHRLRFSEKMPDKLHRKRAKTYPPNFLSRRHTPAGTSRGSALSLANSSTRSSGIGKGLNISNSQPTPPPASSTQGGREPMDFDFVWTMFEEDDGDRENQVVLMEDYEARMDLTDDLLHKIFSFLKDVDLCRAAKVCRQWRAASAHEDFWKSLNFESRQVTQEQVAVLCTRYPKATELNLKGCPCVDEDLVQEAMLSLRNLEVLTLGRGFLSDGFFYSLAGCESLQNLSITDAILGSGGAQEIQLRHDFIRSLQIVKCRVLRIAIRCPQLETLSLKRTGTASAMLHCPLLVNLDVSSCHKLSDAGVRAAATACPLLASLDMSNCAYVSDETLREISLVCTHLRSLDASYCPNISLEGVRLPMLMDLKLVSCEGINSSSMAALSHCVMLEVLAMDYCWLLTAVTLELPRLRSISLGNNRKFVELTLRSPALTSLNLNHCPALSRIDIASSSFEKLSLRQQMGLSSMALQCPWLREVDLTECESLTDSVCDVFSDGGGCPKLNLLTLDNCDGLVEVRLSTSSLSSLSLVGCRNISSLELSCPILQCLQLDGCNRLIAASFAPVGLVALNLGICPHLTTLEVEAAQMTSLDLRGCGVLSQASIRCPHLLSLDASYCSQLGDDCLAETTGACSAIQNLVLAACPAVGPAGLLALKKLPHLTMLDLSYTFLTDLSPIFEACPRLKVLRLSACKYLGETALNALHGGKVLSELQELDMSYGSLGCAAIEGVLALCPHLTQVSLNGCAHVTDHLWSRLAYPPLPAEYVTSEDTGMEDASSPDGVVDEQSPMDVTSSQISPIETSQDNMTSEKELVGDQREGDWQVMSAHDFQLQASGVTVDFFSSLRSEGSSFFEVEHSAGEGQRVWEVGASPQLVFTPMVKSELAGPVRALQTLNCVGCPNIQTVVIQQDAACLHLSMLNLSLSINIREVRLGCDNLTTLNLSQCAALVVLELNCPRLITLCLQACGIEEEMLEHAISGCSLLETLDVRNCSKVSAEALTRMRSVCPGLKRLYSTSSL